MFTVSALALETGGAANETPSFLIVFLVKPWLINAAKFPVCEQSAPAFRRADDSQRSAAPSHRAERTFGSRWSRSASENWLPECFCSSLRPSVPTDAGTDRRRGLSCSQRFMRETGRSGGGMKALKFLMRSLVFSLLKLHTSCLWAGWNNQAHHATHTDKLPPLAPPPASVCHHSRCVPSPCFCGDTRNSVSPPPLSFPQFTFKWSWLMVSKSQQGAVVKENWPSTYKYPASFLRLKVESPTMQETCCRGSARLLPVVWVRHTFSLWLTCLSVMCLCLERQRHPPPPNPQPRRQTQGEVHTRALPVRFCKDRMWRWRKWFWSDWFMAVTPFLWIMRSCEHFGGRLVQNTFSCFAEILKCELFWHALSKRTYCTAAEMEDEGVGGWVGGITRHWLVHPA